MIEMGDRDWLDQRFEELRREIVRVQLDIAALKVKASCFGVIGGMVPIAILLCVYLLTK